MEEEEFKISSLPFDSAGDEHLQGCFFSPDHFLGTEEDMSGRVSAPSHYSYSPTRVRIGRHSIDLHRKNFEFEVPPYVSIDQYIAHNLKEPYTVSIGDFIGRERETSPTQILSSLRTGGGITAPALTNVELSRLSRFARYERSDDSRGEDFSPEIISASTGTESQHISDTNYRAFIDEVDTLSEEYGECVVAYARGKRIGLAQNLPELLASIPEEYDDDDILIQRIPTPSLTVRLPIRVQR